MAGTLFSLAMSQWRDVNGYPEQDAPLYIYQANSSTPVNVYKDFGLSVLHPWPLRTSSLGMIPPFWLPDGSYRARLTNNAGSLVYFDEYVIQAVGPSVGGGGGGGVDQNAIFNTGWPIWIPIAGTLPGWVRANGRTIGSATSGATERANADTQALFEYLYNRYSDDICPVTGGRGANAAADFAANKPIKLLDMRGRGPFGLDDMGNDAAGIITDGSPTTPGTTGGVEKPSITISRSNLPNIRLSVDGETDPHHHKLLDDASSLTSISSGNQVIAYMRPSGDNSYTLSRGTGAPVWGKSSDETVSFEGETESLNGNVTQSALTPNTMSPYMLGTWYIKL